jgi:osmotically-inducible protein OsmY
MPNYNGHGDERDVSNERTDPRGPGTSGYLAVRRDGTMQDDRSAPRSTASEDRGRAQDYDRYAHAFDHVADRGDDHVPDAGRYGRRDARAYGPIPADQGGFGSQGPQGPYGQSAYGQGSYTSRYVPGTNHPYADREAHERYNRAHFPQGPHRGKGPKGFTRSDERLKEHVNELLMEHAEIDATHVEVEVHSGVVSVAGTVEDRQQRRAIEDLIEGIFGVTEVQISIKLANRASSRLLIHARDRGV